MLITKDGRCAVCKVTDRNQDISNKLTTRRKPGYFQPQTKKPGLPWQTGFLITHCYELQRHYVFRLRALLAFANREFNLLAFIQRLASLHGNCTKVYEYITLAFTGNKTKTFFIVEPLYCAYNFI